MVAALHAGKAVTIAPQSMTLTTQQAADLLGVSRPTVVRLIKSGELAAERIGNRHRLVLDDVLAYREARRQPGAAGSVNNVSGSSVNRSPTRVPPPGAEKAVRPSCAPRPAIDQPR